MRSLRSSSKFVHIISYFFSDIDKKVVNVNFQAEKSSEKVVARIFRFPRIIQFVCLKNWISNRGWIRRPDYKRKV